PSPGRVRLRLSARGTDKDILQRSIDDQVLSLSKIIGDIIIGLDEEISLEVEVANLLKAQKKTIATAESCTGGKIAQMLSSVPGASSYFMGSIVPYSTALKSDLLGIPEAVIEKHSVVSDEVTRQ